MRCLPATFTRRQGVGCVRLMSEPQRPSTKHSGSLSSEELGSCWYDPTAHEALQPDERSTMASPVSSDEEEEKETVKNNAKSPRRSPSCLQPGVACRTRKSQASGCRPSRKKKTKKEEEGVAGGGKTVQEDSDSATTAESLPKDDEVLVDGGGASPPPCRAFRSLRDTDLMSEVSLTRTHSVCERGVFGTNNRPWIAAPFERLQLAAKKISRVLVCAEARLPLARADGIASLPLSRLGRKGRRVQCEEDADHPLSIPQSAVSRVQGLQPSRAVWDMTALTQSLIDVQKDEEVVPSQEAPKPTWCRPASVVSDVIREEDEDEQGEVEKPIAAEMHSTSPPKVPRPLSTCLSPPATLKTTTLSLAPPPTGRNLSKEDMRRHHLASPCGSSILSSPSSYDASFRSSQVESPHRHPSPFVATPTVVAEPHSPKAAEEAQPAEGQKFPPPSCLVTRKAEGDEGETRQQGGEGGMKRVRFSID